MNTGLRRRILVLQVGMIGILSFVAGFLFWAASFTHDQITSQLTAQSISFPAAGDASLTALPAADAAAMNVYAGQTMTTGDQAQVYANHYLGVHLNGLPTYEAASAAARADPKDTKAAGTLNTVFRGITLRSMLLNAYGWWTVGSFALYAGIGLAVAAFAVLLAFVFEIWRWRVAIKQTKPVATPSQRLGAPHPA